MDRCIAPIVRALNAGGVLTAGCCCGHGKRRGTIKLQDGTAIIIDRQKTFDDAFSLNNPNNAPHLDA